MLQSEKLKREKKQLIEIWCRVQDQAEELNGRIYEISCEIEAINLKIEQALERERREAAEKRKKAGSAK
ncbi:MAG: hypothetical protein ACYTAF_12410 [Planctomycetota bacterium]|jgi:hypothetical protein